MWKRSSCRDEHAADLREQRLDLEAVVGPARQVDREAAHQPGRLHRIERLVQAREERELVALAAVHVDGDLVAVRPARPSMWVQNRFGPVNHSRSLPSPPRRMHAQVARRLAVVARSGPRRPGCGLMLGHHVGQVQDHVPLGDGEVVHHPGVGRLHRGAPVHAGRPWSAENTKMSFESRPVAS